MRLCREQIAQMAAAAVAEFDSSNSLSDAQECADQFAWNVWNHRASSEELGRVMDKVRWRLMKRQRRARQSAREAKRLAGGTA